MYTVTPACINQLALSYWFVASIFSKLSIHTIRMYISAMQLYLKLTGIPLVIPTRNEHIACTPVLKVSNIPEVAVESEHYRTQLYICLCMYSQYRI